MVKKFEEYEYSKNNGFGRIGNLIDELENLKYFRGNELFDVGNDIGKIIEKYFTPDDNLSDFVVGIKHGISVTNNSHDNNKLYKDWTQEEVEDLIIWLGSNLKKLKGKNPSDIISDYYENKNDL